MVCNVFYCDEKIMKMEAENAWFDMVEYLGELYEKNKINPIGEEILCNAIFVSWYSFTEIENTPARYIAFQDHEYYKKQWKHFISVGLDRYYDNHSVCFLIGYTAYYNKYFKNLKRFGEDMMKKACNNMPLELPYDVMLGKVRKDKNDEYLILPAVLFPGRCIAENHFRDILAQAGIE